MTAFLSLYLSCCTISRFSRFRFSLPLHLFLFVSSHTLHTSPSPPLTTFRSQPSLSPVVNPSKRLDDHVRAIQRSTRSPLLARHDRQPFEIESRVEVSSHALYTTNREQGQAGSGALTRRGFPVVRWTRGRGWVRRRLAARRSERWCWEKRRRAVRSAWTGRWVGRKEPAGR